MQQQTEPPAEWWSSLWGSWEQTPPDHKPCNVGHTASRLFKSQLHFSASHQNVNTNERMSLENVEKINVWTYSSEQTDAERKAKSPILQS